MQKQSFQTKDISKEYIECRNNEVHQIGVDATRLQQVHQQIAHEFEVCSLLTIEQFSITQ